MGAGIIQAIAGDKAGTVVGAVTKAVTDITRTKNPEEAQDKLNADPDAYAALQLKLAEIANDYELARRKAELDLIKEQNKAEAERREAELKEFRARLEDTKGARSAFSQLALANNPMAWGAPIVSFIVTLGSFGILTILIVAPNITTQANILQIVNISVGALAAAFATVVGFWVGSSQGSRDKDTQIQRQAEQAKETSAAAIASQTKQTEALQTTMQVQAKQADALEATVKTAIATKSAIQATKPSNQLQQCLDIVLRQEGVSDRGDATKFGITLEELQSSRHDKSLTADDLRSLTRKEAGEIYRVRYWNVLRCDELRHRRRSGGLRLSRGFKSIRVRQDAAKGDRGRSRRLHWQRHDGSKQGDDPTGYRDEVVRASARK